jgi:hypothetical protein
MENVAIQPWLVEEAAAEETCGTIVPALGIVIKCPMLLESSEDNLRNEEGIKSPEP